MHGPDVSRLAPSDVIATMRSVPRRFRAAIDPLPDDPIVEELTERVGPDGASVLDIAWATASSLALVLQALRQALVESSPVVHAGVVDDSIRQWDLPEGVDIERALQQLTDTAEAVADAVGSVGHGQWDRDATVVGGAPITPLDIAREAARTVSVGLSDAERCLAAVRSQGMGNPST